MKEIGIILPNQLFKESPLINKGLHIFLIEEFLFFRQYNFHKQKLIFQRASMKNYEKFLIDKENTVTYIESSKQISDIRLFIDNLSSDINKIHVIDPNDYLLERRINSFILRKNISLISYENESFLNSRESLDVFFKKEKSKFFQTSFYKDQRKKLNILIDNNSPTGGKWTFDDENRKKYPSGKLPPDIIFPLEDRIYSESISYIEKNFKSNYGEINKNIIYPTNYIQAENWLIDFLKHRFKEFGPYEDAILNNKIFLNHSLLSPLLNSGLLSPKLIIDKANKYYREHQIPINSFEGFIRQIIGWREFIRGIYLVKGSFERTRNFWGFQRKIPKSFYTGNTGIQPVDDTILKIKKSAYCHHIERLMIVGNFMLLCEIDPNHVYKWFMELFIDSYDWVMVPNVYGMSQFADGGLMSTKPYISGSSYIMKMSNYKKGEWNIIWDSLFWRFLYKQKQFFSKNPRMRMLINTFDKMEESKKELYMNTADNYLKKLS